jgi:hypothetical protein
MGGGNYIDAIDVVINTVQRFAYAYSIAADPNAERQEYAKKLYKLLGSSIKSQDIINTVFVKYSGGKGMPAAALKSVLTQAKNKRELDREMNREPLDATAWEPEQSRDQSPEWNSNLDRSSTEYWLQMLSRVVNPNRPKYWYDVRYEGSAMNIEVVGATPTEALVRAKIATPAWRTHDNTHFRMTAMRPYTDDSDSPAADIQALRDRAAQLQQNRQGGGEPVPGSTLDIQRQRAAQTPEQSNSDMYQLFHRRTGQIAQNFEASGPREALRRGQEIVASYINDGLVPREEQENWIVRSAL